MVTLSSIRRTVEAQQQTDGLDSAEVLGLAGSGVNVYETLDSLPATGLTEGDEAFVKSNNRLYVSDGSGWYNITLVNRNVRWDSGGEPDASYTIADSATPLIITARAIDSDNNNLINQAFASDSAQYMVDISSDSSVFTFTPKSADSIGASVATGNLTDSNGDFVYTFKWSDGINFVSKAVTISYNPTGGASFAWGGDRVLVSDTGLAQVDYYDMTTTTNAADFGDLTNPSSNPYAALSDNSRAIFAATNYEYFTIATAGNATAFGNRTSVVDRGQAGLSDGTYGLFAGGYGSPDYQSSIEYVTIQSTGNGSDFGDMTVIRGYAGAAGGTTRGVIGAGFYQIGPSYYDVIDYITFASPGNAIDFGDLTQGRGFAAGLSDETTAVFAGGNSTSYYNIMDYITVDTTGNAQDFGDLIAQAGSICGGTSNNTRGTWNGGYDNGGNATNIVQYITVATPGNATDLLDLTQGAVRGGSAAGNAA